MARALLRTPASRRPRAKLMVDPQLDYVQYKRSKQARRLSLRLDYKSQQFILTIPPFCSVTNANSFLLQHRQWMEDRLAELPQRVAFEDGAVLPIFGHDTEILVLYNERLRGTSFDLDLGHYLTVKTNREDPSMRIERYLRNLAKEELSRLAYEKVDRIGKRIRELSVRDTKSRWGSCTSDAHISLSWRLIFAPYEAMDYVVAHEVAHLRHLNHGARFWVLCEHLSDDYETGKSWMQTHGQDLMRFG